MRLCVGGTAILIFLGAALFRNAARAEEPSRSPFAPGETLTYDVTWSIFRAGEVMATLGSQGVGLADDYEVKATGRSQGFVSLLYKVNNEFRSVFSSETLCSHGISKKIHEGRRNKDTRIVFDAARKLAILEERDATHANEPAKHAENETPECVQDVVSAFYFFRKQPLRVGEQIRIPINDGAKTYDVTVEVQARERIQTPLGGSRAAFRVEPKVFRGLFKRKGRMFIWFSDDDQRLPLRIRAESSIGSITGNLRSVTYAPEKTSPPKEVREGPGRNLK